MTGLLLMADFSRAFQLPPLILRPSNQGQREQTEATIVLASLAVHFLQIQSTARHFYKSYLRINTLHILGNVFINLQLFYLFPHASASASKLERQPAYLSTCQILLKKTSMM